MAKKRIYISSTLDIPEYRNAAEEVFRYCAKYFEVGLIAEYMSPQAESTLAVCLAEVDKCDIYVLIIGRRYGTLVSEANPISFTHAEYNKATAANNPPKDIIVLCAADKATGFTEEKDHPEKFQEFRKLVRATHTSYIKDFSNAIELQSQLRGVLLLRVFENLPSITNDAIEYRCDRVEPATKYLDDLVIAKLDNTKGCFAVLYGSQNEKPRSFTTRLAKLDIGLPIKISLTKSELANEINERKQQLNLARNIYQQLFADERPNFDLTLLQQFATPQAFFALLQEKGVRELFIEFVIDTDTNELLDEPYLNLLKNFTNAWRAAIPDSLFIHCTFSITGQKNFTDIKNGYEAFLGNFPAITDIRELEMITRKHICTWIEKELKITQGEQIQFLVNKHFGIDEFSFCLSVAQDKLQKMINDMYINIQ
jgi:hypothetical protein